MKSRIKLSCGQRNVISNGLVSGRRLSDELSIELLTEKHDRISFNCGEPSLNEYLQRFARQNADSSSSVARADLLEKRLPRYPVPDVLMGRLAPVGPPQGRGFGELLLQDALKRSSRLAQHLGIYAVVVDALNEQARAFYRESGFAETADDPMRLDLPIKKVLQTNPLRP